MTTTLPPEIAAELEKLRDIRLPEDVSWWPLAPGWWALAAIVVLLAAGTAVAILLHRRTLRYRALRELDRLKKAGNLDPTLLAECIEVLLKRIVLHRGGHAALAASHGSTWVNHLSQGAGAFPREMAQFVADAPYADRNTQAPAPGRDALIDTAQRWIRRNA